MFFRLLPTQVILMLRTKEKSQGVIIRAQIQKLLRHAIDNRDDLLVQLLKIALLNVKQFSNQQTRLTRLAYLGKIKSFVTDFS